jgi:hypothetical protein
MTHAQISGMSVPDVPASSKPELLKGPYQSQRVSLWPTNTTAVFLTSTGELRSAKETAKTPSCGADGRIGSGCSAEWREEQVTPGVAVLRLFNHYSDLCRLWLAINARYVGFR